MAGSLGPALGGVWARVMEATATPATTYGNSLFIPCTLRKLEEKVP